MTPAAPVVFSVSRGTLFVDLRTADDAHFSGAQVLLLRTPAIFESAELVPGVYAFTDVPTGSYRLRISRIGYSTLSDTVRVQPQTKQTIRRQLQVARSCDLDCGELTIPSERPWWRRWWPF